MLVKHEYLQVDAVRHYEHRRANRSFALAGSSSTVRGE